MKDCIHFEVCAYRGRNHECLEDCSCYKSVDVVKVVRCKNCGKKLWCDDEMLYWCAECGYRCNNGEWYCAGGERSTNET